MAIAYPESGTLKTARVKTTTDANGDGTILLKIPGTVGVNTRLIQGGVGWFDNPNADDYIKIAVSDEDNILGYGAGVEVGKYYDDEVSANNQGWFAPPGGKIEMDAIADMAHLAAGLYLKIIIKKGDNSIDTFRANIKWGTID